MKIGHARVSTQQQNFDRQLAAQKAKGCELVYAEKASGKDTHKRPKLKKALAAINPDAGAGVVTKSVQCPNLDSSPLFLFIPLKSATSMTPSRRPGPIVV